VFGFRSHCLASRSPQFAQKLRFSAHHGWYTSSDEPCRELEGWCCAAEIQPTEWRKCSEPSIDESKLTPGARARVHNADYAQDILAGLKWADGDDRVKVIVQTGEGKLFTAGLDLQDKSIVTQDTVLSDAFSEVIR
jgi:hypothetical protein